MRRKKYIFVSLCCFVFYNLNATILNFTDANAAQLADICQGYGDNVQATNCNGMSYELGCGWTPNIATCNHNAAYWQNGYGNLSRVAYVDATCDGGDGTMSFTFTAEPGYAVLLNGFDIADYDGDEVINQIRVYNQDCYDFTNLTCVCVEGNNNNHDDYDYAPSAIGETITIYVNSLNLDCSSDAWNIGVDNINFQQICALYWDSDASAGFGGGGTWTNNCGCFNDAGDNNANGCGDGGLLWQDSLTAVFDGCSGTVNVAAGGISANNGITVNSSGYIVQNNTLTMDGATAANNTITVACAGHTATINSVLDDGANNSGFIKAGLGTLVLGGTSANTHTGSTLVSAGTLQLNKTAGVNAIAGNITIGTTAEVRLFAANQIANASDITMNGGTFSTGSGAGSAEQVNNVTLSATSTINLGTGSHVFQLNDLILAGNTLNVTGWTGVAGGTGTAGRIYVQDIDTSGISAATQQTGINFTGFDNGYDILDLGGGLFQIVPAFVPALTPEPSTWFSGGMLLLGALAHFWWRRGREFKKN